MARLDRIWSYHADVLHTDYNRTDVIDAILRIVIEIEDITPITRPLDEVWSVLAAATHVCSTMGMFSQVYSLNACIPTPCSKWEPKFKKKWSEKIAEFHPEFNNDIKTVYLRDLLYLTLQ